MAKIKCDRFLGCALCCRTVFALFRRYITNYLHFGWTQLYLSSNRAKEVLFDACNAMAMFPSSILLNLAAGYRRLKYFLLNDMSKKKDKLSQWHHMDCKTEKNGKTFEQTSGWENKTNHRVDNPHGIYSKSFHEFILLFCAFWHELHIKHAQSSEH